MRNILLGSSQTTTIIIFCVLCAVALIILFVSTSKRKRVFKDKDEKQKDKLLKAAEEGDAKARCEIALNYRYSESGKYLYWLEKAAEQGCEEAMRKLADEYNYGNDYTKPPIKKDREKAIVFLSKLADKGDIVAMKDCALIYAVESHLSDGA